MKLPLRASLDAYKNNNGGYSDGPDNVHHDSATDLLQCGILGFCGCGRPEENLLYVLGGLELIEELHTSLREHDAWEVWWPEYKARELAHFGNENAAYFFCYWCAEQPAELTEHGGSVPGWLTAKGRELLALLREWKATQ